MTWQLQRLQLVWACLICATSVKPCCAAACCGGCPVGAFTITGCGGVACGPGGLVAWATGSRLYRFFEVELHTQVGVGVRIFSQMHLGWRGLTKGDGGGGRVWGTVRWGAGR
jgi:hypothetical protein